MQVASDGAWVLFVSDASNVSTNLHRGLSLDLYLYERTNHKTTLISVDRGRWRRWRCAYRRGPRHAGRAVCDL
jgi:hypothetical protein